MWELPKQTYVQITPDKIKYWEKRKNLWISIINIFKGSYKECYGYKNE